MQQLTTLVVRQLDSRLQNVIFPTATSVCSCNISGLLMLMKGEMTWQSKGLCLESLKQHSTGVLAAAAQAALADLMDGQDLKHTPRPNSSCSGFHRLGKLLLYPKWDLCQAVWHGMPATF